MKIRLVGPAEECDAAVKALRGVLDVLDVSRPYPARREPGSVRVYLEAATRAPGTGRRSG